MEDANARSVLEVLDFFAVDPAKGLRRFPGTWVIPPWSNLWLVGSIILTMLLHLLILYVHPLTVLFSVAPLSWAEGTVVLYLSFPVTIIDEVLKFFSRSSLGTRLNFRLSRVDRLPKRELRDK